MKCLERKKINKVKQLIKTYYYGRNKSNEMHV